MFKLTVEEKFDAAHKLENYEGKCSNVHGHTWKVIVSIKVSIIESNSNHSDMILDFSEIKKVIRKFDHRLLLKNNKENNKWLPYVPGIKLLEYNPTAENISKDIALKIQYLLTSNILHKFRIKVIVLETEKNQVEYNIVGDENV